MLGRANSTKRQRAATMTGNGIAQRQAQQTPVFARLQALFPPNSTATTRLAEPPGTAQNVKQAPPSPGHKALKIRIITWNMHDSLPKGDLEELLGKVPLWSQANAALPGQFPNLGTESGHPYHLVVVAGQECPSMSGIPMGLGAGLNRLIDRDRDRDEEKDRDREKEKEKEKEKEREKSYEKPWHKHRDKDKEERDDHELAAGWTSMLEDWLCQGHGSLPRTGSSPTVADIGFPKPLSPRVPSKEQRKGPYQLLTKERMMGIYMAVFVHRDLRSWVKGTSRSAVTAGLIGGRVGNKGGVGITINLDGTSLLFLNAHLAAHEGKINHRLSNFTKIKAELEVDAFLKPDDPKVMAEDLTDKFDYTFLCGDLNFRLDITRLHADWLLSRRDYAQALAFDQLTRLMHNGQAFVGFSEAPINFPPTFKYDVQRSRYRTKSKLDRRRRLEEKLTRLTEVEEQELEELKKEEAEEEAEAEGEGEAASMASSVWTSAPSKSEREQDEDEFYASPSTQTLMSTSSKVSIAHKAKAKWLSVISPTSPAGQRIQRIRQNTLLFKKPRAIHGSVDISLDGKLAQIAASSVDAVDQTRQRPQISVLSSSLKSKSDQGPVEGGEEGEEKGVYDTSHKKRVPSWCDRILWKTTVDPEEEEVPPQLRPRNRMGQFFANAFRFRRDSSFSVATSTTSESHEEAFTAENHILKDAPSISRSPPPGSVPSRRRSVDIPGGNKPANGHYGDLTLRRSTSASSLTPPKPTPERTQVRRATASAAMLGSQAAPIMAHSQSPTPSRWRFFPSFLSINSTQSSTSMERDLPSTTLPPATPRKGDVVCLSYNTLDDRGMTRLEGRSDHRPVIGTYVVYLA